MLKVELCIILIIMLIDTRAVMQATNAANKDLYKLIFIDPAKKIGIFFWKYIDIKFIDRFGPDGISSIVKYFSLKAKRLQSGYIYQYAFIMLLGFSAILTFLILN